MYVHTREQDSRPGFDGVKIKLLLFSIFFSPEMFAPSGMLLISLEVIE